MNIKRNIIFALESRKKDAVPIVENVPIRMRVIFASQRIEFTTGYRIDVAKWDADKQRVKNGCTNKLKQSAAEINTDLLNYSFDRWMQIHHPEIPFERYADDTVCHCHSKQEAESLYEELIIRFTSCKLSLNEEKTKIVYCKSSRRNENHSNVTFNFLGHTFRPCKTIHKSSRKAFTGFQPRISMKATTKIRATMCSWNLMSKSHTPLDCIAQMVNPILRGWANYYGKYGGKSFQKLLRYFDLLLAKWAKAKYPQIRNYAHDMIQKRKESASLVKRGHIASNVTIKTYKYPLPHHAT